MEDYAIFNEMQNLKNKRVIMFIEDDEDFIINNLIDSDFELIPIRFSYDLSCFSKIYIDKTKELFTYYYNSSNSYNNELLCLKKHFIHFQRFPFIAYIPLKNKYFTIIQMLKDLKVECVYDKTLFINKINNNQKLVLIDNDDTIKRSDGTISQRTKEAILRNKRHGNIIVICTSRPRYQAIEVMKEVGADSIVISSNGSEIYDTGNDKIINSLYIDKSEVFKFIEYAYLNDIRLILTAEGCEYVTKEVRNPKQILLIQYDYFNQLKDVNIKQCMFIDKKYKDIYRLKEIILKNRKVCIADEIREDDPYEKKWFSLANSSASKGNALVKLADYLEFPIKNTVAIGNGKNDISMFDNCGFSVAVANSDKFIKEQVNYITASNDKDGVAIFLENIDDYML